MEGFILLVSDEYVKGHLDASLLDFTYCTLQVPEPVFIKILASEPSAHSCRTSLLYGSHQHSKSTRMTEYLLKKV